MMIKRRNQGVKDYHAGNSNQTDLLINTLFKSKTRSKLSVVTASVSGYLQEKQLEKRLRLLAKQVRTLLARYPAMGVLKQSPAYQ